MRNTFLSTLTAAVVAFAAPLALVASRQGGFPNAPRIDATKRRGA